MKDKNLLVKTAGIAVCAIVLLFAIWRLAENEARVSSTSEKNAILQHEEETIRYSDLSPDHRDEEWDPSEYYFPTHNRFPSGEAPYPRQEDLIFVRQEDFQEDWKKVVLWQDDEGTPLASFRILKMEYVDSFGEYPSSQYISDKIPLLSPDGTIQRNPVVLKRRVNMMSGEIQEEREMVPLLLAVEVEMENRTVSETIVNPVPLCTVELLEDEEWGKYYAQEFVECAEIPFYYTPYVEGLPIYFSESEDSQHFNRVTLEPGTTLRFRLGFVVDGNNLDRTYLISGRSSAQYYYYGNSSADSSSSAGGFVIYAIPSLEEQGEGRQ